MNIMCVNTSLDQYGLFTVISTGPGNSSTSLIEYGQGQLGKSWSEFVVLETTLNEQGIPTVTQQHHYQHPIRKHHIINKRTCSNKPTPQSDLSQPVPRDRVSPQQVHLGDPQFLNNLLRNTLVASGSTTAETHEFGF